MPTTINTSKPYSPMRYYGGAAFACALAFVFGLSCGSHPQSTSAPGATTTTISKDAALMQGLYNTGNDGLRAVSRSDAVAFATEVCAHPGDKPGQLAAILAPNTEIWSRRFLTPANAVDFVNQAVLHYC